MCLSVAVKLLLCVCLLQWGYCHVSVCCSGVIAMCMSVAVSYCHVSVCCSEVIVMCLSVAVKLLSCVCLLQ